MEAGLMADNDVFTADDTMSDRAKHELLSLARITLEHILNGEDRPEYDPENDILRKRAGVFVTLKKNHSLRGCIGTFDNSVPLYLNVQDMAVASALNDPRFPPVQRDELDELSIEISVLSSPFPIEADDVQVGTHGLIIENGPYSGVLLPQVPVEWGWDREEFLDELCLKAGLPTGCWHSSETKLYAFTAVVFEDTYIGD